VQVPQFADADYLREKWETSFSKVISGDDQILVDLRGNLGGTFYGGLHFLSLFLCEPTEVGKLTTKNPKSSAVFPLSPQMTDQIQTLMKAGELILKTPRSQSCFKNKVTILLNQETASMAEIVALVLKEQRQAVLLGGSSAGETTIGFWYDYDEVVPGAQLTIPEARFISKENRDLEGQGLVPDQRLFEKSEHWKNGQDSLIEQIIHQN
jgi:C-terminal processing protease CtpA/Prc